LAINLSYTKTYKIIIVHFAYIYFLTISLLESATPYSLFMSFSKS